MFLIDHAKDAGGAERLMLGLATRLPRDRFETWVCATRTTEPAAADALAAAGVRQVTLGRTGKWDVYRFRSLIRVLRSQRIDILHSHMFGSNLWGTLIGTACRIPVIVAHEHTWSYEGHPTRAWLDGHVISRLADRFVAVSTFDGERMVSVEGVKPGKIVVIPNGYIPRPPSSGDIRAELGLSATAPLIAIAAVFRRQKRLDLLLQAYALVKAAVPDSHLVLAGEGPCRESLVREAAELGLDGHVHFLGRRSDVDSVLRSADVGALASDFEGSPLFVFECMANDTPIVATNVGGVPDVVVDGETGLLVPRRNPEAMADALISLLSDPARRAGMAKAGRVLLAAHTIDATTDRIVSLYETLAA